MAFFCGEEAGCPDSRLMGCRIGVSGTVGGTTKEGINASAGRGCKGRVVGGCKCCCGMGWCGVVGTVVPACGGPGG